MRNHLLIDIPRVLIVSLALAVVVIPGPAELHAQSGDNELCPEGSRWNPFGPLAPKFAEAMPDDVVACLAGGADPEAALAAAVSRTRFPAVVQLLLDAGADPNAALRVATEREGNVPVVRDILAALLDANADVSERYYGRAYTPLHLLLASQPQ